MDRATVQRAKTRFDATDGPPASAGGIPTAAAVADAWANLGRSALQQGQGDTLQFIRCAPRVKQAGGMVQVEARE